MELGRVIADAEPRCNLAVRKTLSEKLEHFSFAGCEFFGEGWLKMGATWRGPEPRVPNYQALSGSAQSCRKARRFEVPEEGSRDSQIERISRASFVRKKRYDRYRKRVEFVRQSGYRDT